MWFYRSIFGPHLYYIYRNASGQSMQYEPNVLERYTDACLNALYAAYRISYYISPFLLSYAFHRGVHRSENHFVMVKFVGTLSIFIFSCYILRGAGRWWNGEYRKFLEILSEAKTSSAVSKRRSINQFDFDFYDWPVDYVVKTTAGSFPKTRRGIMSEMKILPCRMLSYILVNTFGRAMLYPGSVSLFQMALRSALASGRAKLIKELHGQRYKVKSYKGNEIDCMFLDRRGSISKSNGRTLVICSEGNAGFYEIGMMSTPAEAGYSVLGWNHPGFGGSTGRPDPDQEVDAIDGVIQFAINSLGFQPENIVLHAWSIGGFTATWASQYYPGLRALILDATFDDVLSLALPRFPPSWAPLVTLTVREHFNLHNKQQLVKFQGPVRIIRRTLDEVIATTPGDVSTNRGNHLLLSFLENRFPNIVKEEAMDRIRQWLGAGGLHKDAIYGATGISDEICVDALKRYVQENTADYPVNIGNELNDDVRNQLALYLARVHLTDFEATHCVPLPEEMFEMPWDIRSL